jgi:hypothetical protein
MRSLLITAAVVTAAIALGGCPYHRQQPPVPGPQTSVTPALTHGAARHTDAERSSRHDPTPDPISWFQGTLDEAFSRRPCRCEQPQFRY